MNNNIIYLFYCVMLAYTIVLIVMTNRCAKVKYCNSSFDKNKDGGPGHYGAKLYEPLYKVIRVEKCLSKNSHNEIAKYTLSNIYLENQGSVEIQELILYAEMGKYTVGDILRFKKDTYCDLKKTKND